MISKEQTPKSRLLELKLHDVDFRRLAEYAAEAELTVAELLEGFISDLVNGASSHGSDEREFANQWYNRCGFSHYNNYSLLHYLISIGFIDEFVGLWTEFCYYKSDMENCKKELENPTTAWQNITSNGTTPCYATLEEYLQSVKDNYDDSAEMMTSYAEDVEERWNEYLKWTSKQNPDKETEIATVIDWHSKYVQNPE